MKQKKLILENDYQKVYAINCGAYQKLTIESNDGVVIVLEAVGGYYFINHKRTESTSLEFLRGFVENNEKPVEAALREIKEELNIKKENIFYTNYLNYVQSDNAVTDQKIHIFLVQLKNNINLIPQKEENVLNYEWISHDDLKNRKDEIHDALTLAALEKLN